MRMKLVWYWFEVRFVELNFEMAAGSEGD